MTCLYRERIVKCGQYMTVHIYPVYANGKKTRRARYKPTTEVQAALNKKYSDEHLTNLINANFTSDDVKLELTFEDEYLPSDEVEADRHAVNFLRRVKRKLAKMGKELKYVKKLERGSRSGRYHLHIVMTGGLSVKAIADEWAPLGYVRRIAPLMFDENGVSDLAAYFTKDRVGFKRYSCSRNLKQPEVIERTGRLSAKKVSKLAEDSANLSVFGDLYPGYKAAAIDAKFNLLTQKDYIVAKFYRNDANIYKNKPAFRRRKKKPEDLLTVEDWLSSSEAG